MTNSPISSTSPSETPSGRRTALTFGTARMPARPGRASGSAPREQRATTKADQGAHARARPAWLRRHYRRFRFAREAERPTGWLFPMEASVSCRGQAPPSRTSTRAPSTPVHSAALRFAWHRARLNGWGDPAPGLSGGGGIRTLGRPYDRQRFSRPPRNGRYAASELESASRGNVGGNESQPPPLGDAHRQRRRPRTRPARARSNASSSVCV
jgi:hypothetical protein